MRRKTPKTLAKQTAFVHLRVGDIKANPKNPRKHDRAQIDAIARSIEAFGFNAPILLDRNDQIVAGHGRLEAAKTIGLSEVPAIRLEHLSPTQARSYMLADNQLTDRSSWDDASLATHLRDLSEMALDFDIQSIGFELPEIDIRIQSLADVAHGDAEDEFANEPVAARTKLGSIWQLGEHRIHCADALCAQNYSVLLGKTQANAVFTDPPYNVKIGGNVSGKGKSQHREFVMASGEMSEQSFTEFLTQALEHCSVNSVAGSILYVCMDFRHMFELINASRRNDLDLLNLCVWIKTNGGMGSFYRSQHELIFVLRNKGGGHRNNVQLGRFGRNRSNVWDYAGANVRPRGGAENVLSLHPTVKPITLVADAIRDCTDRGGVVLDPFAGSGTTILAAERTGRKAYCLEIDPGYVDVSIARWERMTKKTAKNVSGPCR